MPRFHGNPVILLLWLNENRRWTTQCNHCSASGRNYVNSLPGKLLKGFNTVKSVLELLRHQVTAVMQKMAGQAVRVFQRCMSIRDGVLRLLKLKRPELQTTFMAVHMNREKGHKNIDTYKKCRQNTFFVA